ncbi:MAG TPA: hypothetical protein VFJ82_15435 [Longimicrobium sp.]|nr:hypothetical protein [Longimicrobium sp.]
MRKTIGALALVLMAAVPARAQQHDHAQMQHGQMQHGDMAQMMMLHHGAHAALMHRADLALNADQVRRLTEVDSLQARAMRDHCAQVRAAGGPNEQTHAAMHPRMMATLQGFQHQVEGILTAPQKAKLDSLMQAHHGPMAGHDMAAMHAQHGDAAQHDSMHAAHHGAGAGAGDQHECMDGCTEAGCCHMMGCGQHEGHGEHAGHTAG